MLVDLFSPIVNTRPISPNAMITTGSGTELNLYDQIKNFAQCLKSPGRCSTGMK